MSANYAESILNAGRELGRKVEVIETPVGPYLVTPEGVDTESLVDQLPAPKRLKQAVAVDTEQSFIDYVRLFAQADMRAASSSPAAQADGTDPRPVVFASLRGSDAKLTAVLDYHPAPWRPSWNQHRVTLPLVFARAFSEWYAANGKALSQTDFATFIENHIAQIAMPDGGKLHEMCLKFEATKTVEFKSHHRVADGSVQFTYNEDVQGTVVGREMKLPAEIVLQMPLFDAAPEVQIEAKLRFRVADGGRLSVWFDLQNVQDLIEAQRTAVADRVRAALDGVVRGVIFGQA